MRLPSTLVAVPLLAAIACSDAASPTTSPADAASSARTAGVRACHPPEIVGSITSLYPARDRGTTLQRYHRARVLVEQGEVELAWPHLVALAGEALQRAQGGTLLDPRGPTTTADGVATLVDQLYVCGGREPLGDLLADLLVASVDLAITTVAPDEPTHLVVPSANFGLVDEESDFFDEHGLLVVYREPDGPPFLPQEYTEHPPRYQVHVLPASAQTNFGLTPGPGDPTMLVIICPRDPHPTLENLDILRVPDAFPTEPAQLLDAQHVHGYGVTCSEVGEYPASQAGAGASFGDRVFGLLRRGASSAFGWLAPEPLYAVDGGIGGESSMMSSFVTVSSAQTGPTPGEDVVVINDMNLLDNTAMRDPNNVRFVQNLVGYATDGPRANATRVLYDRGRGAPCVGSGECTDASQTTIDAVVTQAGFAITKYDDVRSYETVPADVKVIFLYNPTVAFTADDVAGLRQFAAEGGRVVFLGEHIHFYGQTGLDVENALLSALGAQMTNVGAAIDCGYQVLPATSIREHQTTTGIDGLTVACLSEVVLGPDDHAILYDMSNTRVIAGVAKIGVPSAVARRSGAGIAPNARRGAPSASETASPTVNGAGLPISPR